MGGRGLYQNGGWDLQPPTPEKAVEVEGVVDAGAMYTVVRRDLFEPLGIKTLERRRFKDFGGYVERDVGEAGLALAGRRRVVPVIFGEADDAVVAGGHRA
ncbi:MAG: aspartyl protease [Pyrobaculum sp.]|uniref:aspartyl protease n=1 Tax=Pyrobaculum sp. TaxID=2004705 RepID=UPI003EE9194F